jgi:pilus assembly protein CpaC
MIMKTTKFFGMRSGARALLLFGAACLASTAMAQANNASLIQVEAGTHQLIRESQAVVRVAVGDPAIADVNVINRRELLVTGKAAGITSLMVWSQGVREPKSFRIRVGPVRDPMAERADSELARANIDPGRGLSGPLPNMLAHRRAVARASSGADAASLVDSSVIDLETQVLTEIKIAEVSRTTAQRYGLNFVRNTPGGTGGVIGPGGLSNVSPIGSSTGLVPLQNAFNLVVDRANGVLGVLSLLERKGMARTLAEPSLVAMTGQTASFLAGGEFPVPVSQGGATAGGITVEFKEFGVRLNLTPTVLARERISLKVAPEVSELDFNAGIQIGGVAVPALIVRRTDTTVELGSGESFVISGLVSTSMINNVDKIPWLGDIPILGAFFKSAGVSREERELIMVVTPHLVRPMRQEANLPPLPGHQEDRYRPRFDQILMQETGRFDQSEFGFSR